MAAVVNVRRDVQDGFYRYKMPQLLTKIEGKGNGIKTVIPNMADVAKALTRPPSYPTKFFGFELGAQTSSNDETERYIVNGAHDASRLRELLDSFIDKFVLCQACKNPETELIVTKDNMILSDCKACGKRSYLDMRHKLSTFILKHPPKSAAKKVKGGSKTSGTAGADSLASKDRTSALEAQADQDDQSDDELTKRIESGAKDRLPDPSTREIKDDDWGEDTSAEAVAARLGSLGINGPEKSSLLADINEEDAEAGEVYDEFGTWLKNQHKEDGSLAVTDAEIYKKMSEMGIAEKHKSLVVLFQALFTDNVSSEIKGHLPLIAKLITSEKHLKAFLGGMERHVTVQYPDTQKKIVPIVLMNLYQSDIADEDALRDWASHVSRKYVDKSSSKKARRAAEPFIAWLDEASEEESDEESDDE